MAEQLDVVPILPILTDNNMQRTSDKQFRIPLDWTTNEQPAWLKVRMPCLEGCGMSWT